MSDDKYRNEEGVYIEAHGDSRGKDHINFYSDNPRGEHTSIHIDYDSETGKGKITDTTSGEKETTDTSCYLTTACMRNKMNNFDDNCEELTILRWFRDKYVSKEDIEHYYSTAPIVVEAINDITDNKKIYNYIYENVVLACVDATKRGDYEFAYNRYRNSVLTLEKQFAKPVLHEQLIKTLKIKLN